MSSSSDTPAPGSTRELAAIMFSHIAGYTLIMGRDEQRALGALNEHRELLRGLLPRFNGRMLGEIGDGTLCRAKDPRRAADARIPSPSGHGIALHTPSGQPAIAVVADL